VKIDSIANIENKTTIDLVGIVKHATDAAEIISQKQGKFVCLLVCLLFVEFLRLCDCFR
jgi:hypothetical protein